MPASSQPQYFTPIHWTYHARRRSRTRGIPDAAIEAALDFGLMRSVRGADTFLLGWRQVDFYLERHGIDLSRWVGVEVICARDGRVVTVYRNRNPHALRAKGRRRRQPPAA